MRSGSRRLTFLTREGCTICADAYDLLMRAARLRRIDVQVVDVDGHPALADLYGDRVPVILSHDGEVLAEGRLTKADARLATRR